MSSEALFSFKSHCLCIGVNLTPPQLKQFHYDNRPSFLAQRQHADLAGKITGMLLEIDNSELLHMLEDPASLQGKVHCTTMHMNIPDLKCKECLPHRSLPH